LKRTISSFLFVCGLLAANNAGLFAQTPGATASSSPIVTQDANPRLKTQISMRAQDASLSEILKILAERSGMNFVTGEGVYKEKITIILNKTPVDEAIDLVVRAAGLSYEIVGNSVLIAEADKLKGEVGQQGYVVALKYANAGEVAIMLGDLTKYVKVDQGGNRLVCYTSPRVIFEIERIVKSIDHPHIQVMLDTRIVEVSMDKANQYGLSWGSVFPISGGIGHPEASIQTGYTKTGWILRALDFNAKLDLMVQNNDARILMNSKMTTTNNREASLHIGDVIPYTIQSYNMGGMGGGANQQIMKENVGVILTMTPHVNDNRQVTLQLEPEVSNIVGWVGVNQDMPMTRVRKTKTTVRVEDGQTVFLAGLISEEATKGISKIPVLGDIPLLGRLFSHKTSNLTKKNLIIEITPKILWDSTSIEVRKTEASGGKIEATPAQAPVQNSDQQETIEVAPAPVEKKK
jgi:type II secretory pathway component GspD/PulD (secretin)